MIRSAPHCLLLPLALMALAGCPERSSSAKSKEAVQPARVAKAPAKTGPRPAKEGWTKPGPTSELVFDPANPPDGYFRCHNNHCHMPGGGVASYQQVMNAMGATRIKGVLNAGDMPPAPPDVAAPPVNASRTASGLASLVLTPGKGGPNPTANSIVKVHYTGWTTDGRAFDSSVARDKPAQFPLSGVISGWTEGLQLMVVGEERRFWIPQALAYQGRRGKPAGVLVFDVELLEIIR